MKIPLIVLPNYRKHLTVERAYSYKRLIVPIGYDCHPAYILTKLKVRQCSLPFDWLNSDPVLGVKYVTENLATNFSHFMSGLQVNESGNIVSGAYNYTEFLHEKDLIESEETRSKFERRIARFLKLYRSQNCCFLYNMHSASLTSTENVKAFIESVLKFVDVIKANDTLHIYIRHDEDEKENKSNVDSLCRELRQINKVSVSEYVRGLKKFGIWGDDTEYLKIFSSLGLRLKRRIPKVYIE